jgi:riboflavin synthase
VEAKGMVRSIAAVPSGRGLRIDTAGLSTSMALGDSLSVNGCCLTVVAIEGEEVSLEVGPETLTRTNLGELKVGNVVNLERALAANGRLGGHFVQGHIDGTAVVKSRASDGVWETVWFTCGPLSATLIPKGSVAVDGVSLTVCDVTEDAFSVMLIPHTLAETTLGTCPVGARVNIETDMIGKYVLRMLANVVRDGAGPALDRLNAAGIL